MASSEITDACNRVLLEMIELKRQLETISEDTTHQLHNSLIVPAVPLGSPTDTRIIRCFDRVDSNELLRMAVVQPLRASIDALDEVARRSVPTMANARAIWSTWVATHALYIESQGLYHPININDIESTCVYRMADGMQDHMHGVASTFGGDETYKRMREFEQWVWGHTGVFVHQIDADDDLGGWLECVGEEFEWPCDREVNDRGREWRMTNPEWDYTMHSDRQGYEFVLKNFGTIVADAYDCLIPGAFRADLLRLAFLYVNGGVYVDSDMKPMAHGLDDILQEVQLRQPKINDCVVLCRCAGVYHGIYNAFMAAPKQSPLILHMLQVSVANIQERKNASGWDPTAIAGPSCLKSVFRTAYSAGRSSKTPLGLSRPRWPDYPTVFMLEEAYIDGHGATVLMPDRTTPFSSRIQSNEGWNHWSLQASRGAVYRDKTPVLTRINVGVTAFVILVALVFYATRSKRLTAGALVTSALACFLVNHGIGAASKRQLSLAERGP